MTRKLGVGLFLLFFAVGMLLLAKYVLPEFADGLGVFAFFAGASGLWLMVTEGVRQGREDRTSAT